MSSFANTSIPSSPFKNEGRAGSGERGGGSRPLGIRDGRPAHGSRPDCRHPMIPYGKQWIDDVDVEAVEATMRSEFLTCGPRVEEFERVFAGKTGAKHAVAVNSGTAALHLAMVVADLGPGDRVLTSPNTFLASANAAAFVGATPDFADIDATTYNLCAKELGVAWKDDVRAVVAVAYAGQAPDMPAIAGRARAAGAVVIEDACHGVGGGFFHNGRSWKLGGHPWADMSIFSFHPVKTMTTGEGGMLVTDNEAYAERARCLRTHGMVRAPASFAGLGAEEDPELAERGPWYYEMQELGFNYRITDLQCALGTSQLERLDAFVARRREIVASYNAAFSGMELLTVPGLRNAADEEFISWHLYTVQIDFAALGKTRTKVMGELREKGVGAQVLYIPVHLQPWYRKRYGYGAGKCPVAEAYYPRALSLPLYAAMSDGDVQSVIDAVTNVVGTA